VAQERLSMHTIREILRLRYGAGLSPRQIAASVGSALSTVQTCLRRADAVGVSWPLPEGLDDEGLEQRLYPRRPRPSAIPLPDFAHVLISLLLPAGNVLLFMFTEDGKLSRPCRLALES